MRQIILQVGFAWPAIPVVIVSLCRIAATSNTPSTSLLLINANIVPIAFNIDFGTLGMSLLP